VIIASVVIALLPDPVPVELVDVVRGPMRSEVLEDGRTRVRDRYDVTAPVTGTLLRVEVEPGDSVRGGRLLARIAPPAAMPLDPRTRAEVAARVTAAEAGVREARAAVTRAADAAALASREAERQRALYEAGAAAERSLEETGTAARARAAELDAARAAVQIAEAEVAARRATLASLGARAAAPQAAIPVRAPADGVVLAVLRESEGPIQAGEPVLTLGDRRALEIEVDLLTADAALIAAGAPVRIEQWGGSEALSGHVSRVDPSAFTRLSALGVEEQRVNVIVALDEPYERWKALGDGYRIEARILVWSAESVVTVPASAMVRQGDAWAVFQATDGRARLVPVETGRRTDTQVEITGGLAPGDRVVAYPGEQVRDGVHIAERGGD
jgi:HlyD family secretion protein